MKAIYCHASAVRESSFTYYILICISCYIIKWKPKLKKRDANEQLANIYKVKSNLKGRAERYKEK